MKTLLIYASRHGCAEQCAAKIQSLIDNELEIIDIKKSLKAALDDYDTIIIGGSIHAGQIQKKIKTFCRDQLDALLAKKVGLFLCCMETGDKAEQQLLDAFPEKLITHASAKGLLGGEFNFDKMNFLEKTIVKKVAKIDKTVSKIDDIAISQFVKKLTS